MELFNERGIALYIEEKALAKMLSCAHYYCSIEAGGIILGKKVVGFEKYIITDIGTPTRFDRQAPLSFVRNKKDAQILTNEAWRKSNGIINRIGEWHSHVFPSPIPSTQDRYDMYRTYRDGEFVFDHFFTLIVASDDSIFVGVVEQGSIINSNIIRMGRECTDIVRKNQQNPDENLRPKF